MSILNYSTTGSSLHTLSMKHINCTVLFTHLQRNQQIWRDISVKIRRYCIFMEGGGGTGFMLGGYKLGGGGTLPGGGGGTIYTRGFTNLVGVLFKLGGALWLC